MNRQNAFRSTVVCALTLVVIPGAWALPKFARKEGKECGYCHVRPSGGGPRNAAGQWYEDHNFSFAGYVPPKDADDKPGTDKPAATEPPATKPAPVKKVAPKPSAKKTTAKPAKKVGASKRVKGSK